MIIKGFSITRGSAHAAHLLRTDENEHVRVHEVRGFVASDPRGAFKESAAVARGTQCKAHLFSCAFSPPKSATLSTDEFLLGIEKAEQALGLQGQPRVIVFHEKEGSAHAHCVWSRIDAQNMKAVHLSHWKTKLGAVSRELFREFGLEIPRGLQDKRERSKTEFTQSDAELAKRRGEDPRELKALVQKCWSTSDDRKSFEQALLSNAMLLARGDKRGLVVVDHHGDAHSLTRLLSLKSKDVKAKLGIEPHQRSVEAAKAEVAKATAGDAREKIRISRERFSKREVELKKERSDLLAAHRAERSALMSRHADDWTRATAERQARMPRGIIKSAWSWLSGEAARIRKENEEGARAQLVRQTGERESAEGRQRDAQRALADHFRELRRAQARELSRLRRDLAPHLKSERAIATRVDRNFGLGLKLER